VFDQQVEINDLLDVAEGEGVDGNAGLALHGKSPGQLTSQSHPPQPGPSHARSPKTAISCPQPAARIDSLAAEKIGSATAQVTERTARVIEPVATDLARRVRVDPMMFEASSGRSDFSAASESILAAGCGHEDRRFGRSAMAWPRLRADEIGS